MGICESAETESEMINAVWITVRRLHAESQTSDADDREVHVKPGDLVHETLLAEFDLDHVGAEVIRSVVVPADYDITASTTWEQTNVTDNDIVKVVFEAV